MTDRREVLTRIAWVLGGALSPQWVLHAHTHASAAGGGIAYGIRTLNARQNAFVTAICDVIIPQTTSPAASGARVNEFIDMMLTDWYPEGERVSLLNGVDELDQRCTQHCGRALAELDAQQQFAFVDGLDADMVAAREAGTQTLPVFALIKELALIGYYTSEVGLNQELNSIGPVGVADFGPAGPPTGMPRY